VRLLIVAATAAEIDPLLASVRQESSGDARLRRGTRGDHAIDVLTTGVGMVATAAWCSHALAMSRYDMALNVGVCGSFDPAIEIRAVVHVISEQLPEMGAEADQAFLTLEELGLLASREFPFRDGRLMNADPPANVALQRLPCVHGITVNTVHGNQRSIATVRQRCKPQVESMEGAAFMYACLIHHVRFAEVRAVSNVVETRNRAAWKLTEAIGNLNAVALDIIDHA
jgi:futalosine hydrolase